MEWQDELSVGIAGVDAQHRGLIDMINELHEAMKRGKVRLSGAILGEMVYAATHFAAEAAAMTGTPFRDSQSMAGAQVFTAKARSTEALARARWGCRSRPTSFRTGL
jgi:hemerythrin-like metal-binding protein